MRYLWDNDLNINDFKGFWKCHLWWIAWGKCVQKSVPYESFDAWFYQGIRALGEKHHTCNRKTHKFTIFFDKNESSFSCKYLAIKLNRIFAKNLICFNFELNLGLEYWTTSFEKVVQYSNHKLCIIYAQGMQTISRPVFQPKATIRNQSCPGFQFESRISSLIFTEFIFGSHGSALTVIRYDSSPKREKIWDTYFSLPLCQKSEI